MRAEVLRELREGRFDEAATLADSILRHAAAESQDRLIEDARAIVSWKGIFPNAGQAAASVSYVRAVVSTLEELAGPDSGAAMAAASNLAGVLASADQVSEAIDMSRRVYDYVQRKYPADDRRFLDARDSLAFLYRRAGNESAARELYRHTGICEHLSPVEQLLREQGRDPYSCGRPWSDNCHIWAFFDCVLDCERLISDLQLDSCVQIHDHRGTHDGSERGIVCAVHHDGIMGRNPLG